jgi:hypothetical protein
MMTGICLLKKFSNSQSYTVRPVQSKNNIQLHYIIRYQNFIVLEYNFLDEINGIHNVQSFGFTSLSQFIFEKYVKITEAQKPEEN